RYHRLASPAVASMLESIMSVAITQSGGDKPGHALRLGPRDKAMRQARTCYDHLAGQFAVALADHMVAQGYVAFPGDWGPDDGGILSAAGVRFLQGLRVDLSAAKLHGGKGRGAHGAIACRPCLDWSERRPHIAG